LRAGMVNYDVEQVLRLYEPGDFFGERALLVDGPRSATVINNDAPARLYRLSAASYQRFVLRNRAVNKSLEKIQHDYMASFLQTVPLLAKMNPQELDAVISMVGHLFMRVHWVAVPEALRARRVNQ
jgi:CRP-like cAMP-binding protein